MRITMKLADGTEEAREVERLEIHLGPWPLEIIQEQPMKIRLSVEGAEEKWASMRLCPGVANVVALELIEHEGREERSGRKC